MATYCFCISYIWIIILLTKPYKPMKILLSTVLFVLTISFYAQPVINSTNINFNTVVNRYTASPVGFSIGGSGANQVWDYTSIALTQINGGTNEVVTSAPFASVFPSSNQYVKTTSNGVSYYYFMLLTSSKIELLGIASDTAIIVNFSPNPQTIFEFPFVYNLLINDTYSTTNNPNSNAPFSLKYDAYGTLKTPFGTFTNVYRVKKIDGLYPDYNWYLPNSNHLILGVGFDSNGVTTVKFNEHLFMNINENETKINILPNPTTHFFEIQNTRKNDYELNFKIIDLTGKAVMFGVSKYNSNINVEVLKTGIYIIEIYENDTIVYKRKMVKQ